MAASVSVVVPFRGDGGPRDNVWAWLRPKWRWPVEVGEPPPGPWCKAAAVAEAVERAAGDILIVADADVWCNVDDAIDAIDAGAAWAIPHGNVHRLTEQGTTAVMAGRPFTTAGLCQRPYKGHTGGGIVVLQRDTFESVPMDPRFVGWGQEDDAWGVALTTLAGKPWRGTEPLWHLWHPPAERMNRAIGNRAGERLWHRYRRAMHNPDRMRAIVAESEVADGERAHRGQPPGGPSAPEVERGR